MPQFQRLQKRIFPVYFNCQVVFAILTAATHPPLSLLSLIKDVPGLIPLSVVLIMDLLNWSVYGPRTIQFMVDRIDQGATNTLMSSLLPLSRVCLTRYPEVKDGKSYQRVEGMSAEMERLNHQFSRNHAMSIHLNAISMVATVIYGFRLASRLSI